MKLNKLTQILKDVRNQPVVLGLNTIKKTFTTLSNTPKKPKGKPKESISKKTSNITNTTQRTPSKRAKIPKEEIVETEENFIANLNSYNGLKQTTIPLKQKIPEKKDLIVKKSSPKGKRAKKANRMSIIDENINIDKLDINELVIDKITLGNEHSNDLITGQIKCDSSDKNPYDNYIKVYSSRKAHELISHEFSYTSDSSILLPVMVTVANGPYVQDINKFIYIDFASGTYSANFGHNNTHIIKPFIDSISTLPTSIKYFYNPNSLKVSSFLKGSFDYNKIFYVTSKLELLVKSLQLANLNSQSLNRNKVVVLNESISNSLELFKPYIINTPFDNIEGLQEVLEKNKDICAVYLEPIDIDKGFIIPEENYLQNVRKLCTENNVLMIVDETRTSLETCSNMSLTLKNKIKGDIFLLGESFTSSYIPHYFLLTSSNFIKYSSDDENDLEYSVNPLQMKLAESSIAYMTENTGISYNVDVKEGIIASYLYMNCKLVKEVRGRGLYYAFELHRDSPVNAFEVSLYLMERGILSRVLTDYIVSICPPLTIQESEIYKACSIIVSVFKSLENVYQNYSGHGDTQFNVNQINNLAREIVTKRYEAIQEVDDNLSDQTMLAELSRKMNKI